MNSTAVNSAVGVVSSGGVAGVGGRNRGRWSQAIKVVTELLRNLDFTLRVWEATERIPKPHHEHIYITEDFSFHVEEQAC